MVGKSVLLGVVLVLAAACEFGRGDEPSNAPGEPPPPPATPPAPSPTVEPLAPTAAGPNGAAPTIVVAGATPGLATVGRQEEASL